MEATLSQSAPTVVPSGDGGAAPRAFRLKHFFWWCLPALIVGITLRVGLLAAIPEAYFGSDSSSYFEATEKLWKHGHHFVLKAKRRWVYPILCLPLPALPWSTAKSVAFLQHLMGLGIIVGVGWIVAHITRYRAVWTPLATMLMAMNLDLLRDEHEIIGDSVFLAAIVATVALAMPLGILRQRRRLFWFLVMAAVVVAIKPHGRGIWVGCVLAAMFITRNPWRWKVEAWLAVVLGLAVILTSGEKRQAKWLLLNSTLPFVNVDAPKWSKYRLALKPMVLKARHDYEMGQYAWTQRDYKKPLGDGNPATIDPVWAELAARKDETEYLQVCSDLAMEALLSHPFGFVKLTVTKIGIAFAEIDSISRFSPAEFWRSQAEGIQDLWVKYPHELQLYYRLDKPQFDLLVEERKTRPNAVLPLMEFLHGIQTREPLIWLRENLNSDGIYWLTPGCLAVLAAIGLGFCLRPSRWAATSVIWLPPILLMITVFAVGDCKTQYVLPVRWAWVAVIMAGLDGVAVLALSKLTKTQTESAAVPDETKSLS